MLPSLLRSTPVALIPPAGRSTVSFSGPALVGEPLSTASPCVVSPSLFDASSGFGFEEQPHASTTAETRTNHDRLPIARVFMLQPPASNRDGDGDHFFA